MQLAYQTNTWGGVVGHPVGVTSIKDLYYLANGSTEQAIREAAEMLKSFAGVCPDSSGESYRASELYYLLGDYASAISHLKELGDSEQVLELLLSSAYKSGDSATMRDAAEKLVLQGKTQYWANLLTGAENTKGLKDHQQLDEGLSLGTAHPHLEAIAFTWRPVDLEQRRADTAAAGAQRQ